MVVELTDGEGDSVKVVGNPLKFAGYSTREHAYPRRLGADTRAILGDLAGLSPEEVSRLAEQGVIALG